MANFKIDETISSSEATLTETIPKTKQRYSFIVVQSIFYLPCKIYYANSPTLVSKNKNTLGDITNEAQQQFKRQDITDYNEIRQSQCESRKLRLLPNANVILHSSG